MGEGDTKFKRLLIYNYFLRNVITMEEMSSYGVVGYNLCSEMLFGCCDKPVEWESFLPITAYSEELTLLRNALLLHIF